MEISKLAEAWEIADGDLNFTPPLRFEFAQSSDQTGEYYVRKAQFIDANDHVIMDIACNGDWVDTQMHAIAAVLTLARQSLAPA